MSYAYLYQVYIKFVYECTCIYSSLCYSRTSSFFYIYILDSHPRLLPSTLNFAFLYSICKNIQVRCYIVVSTVRKFYTFSLEYGMQSDRPQSDLRRSKANPNPRTQVKRHRKLDIVVDRTCRVRGRYVAGNNAAANAFFPLPWARWWKTKGGRA